MWGRLARAVGAAVLVALLAAAPIAPPDATAQTCVYWVAPAGSDSNPGTRAQPWASLDYASARVFAEGRANCTVWFLDGLYEGASDLHERFTTPTTFRALNPYRAILENNGQVVELSGVRNITLEGFEIRHARDNVSPLVVYVSRAGNLWSEHVTLRNNIIHDSYNNDLLKIHNGARLITVEGNIFYNQGPGEEHIDVNGVEDVLIHDNIFFNDFAGSGRDDGADVHSFITIKDSTGNPGGAFGSRRIKVRRNVFLNWEGRRDTFIQVGNDGKPYHEAVDIAIENNLLVGNAPSLVYAALGLRGVRGVSVANNTIVGDLPSSAYAFWVDTKDLNPPNEAVTFHNNIWSDPTGTMGADSPGSSNKFSNGNPANTAGLSLDNNLYWNGGAPIPPGDLVSPLEDDARRLVGDPLLPQGQGAALPRRGGVALGDGSATVRQAFTRLVERYGVLGPRSAALDRADPALAPADDILGRARGARPDMGAYEAAPATPTATRTAPTATRPAPSPTRPRPTPTTPAPRTPTSTPPGRAPINVFLPGVAGRRRVPAATSRASRRGAR